MYILIRQSYNCKYFTTDAINFVFSGQYFYAHVYVYKSDSFKKLLILIISGRYTAYGSLQYAILFLSKHAKYFNLGVSLHYKHLPKNNNGSFVFSPLKF